MSIVARGTKASAGGGTSFVANTDALAEEVEFDFATLYGDYNGSIADANIAASAAIETTKIDGYSDTATEMADEASPGTSTGTSAPSTLRGELQRLRYKIREAGLGTSTVRLDGTPSVDLVSWFDTPMVGPNLIRNSNFAVKTTAAAAAPDGWALVGTPGTCELTAAGVTEGHATARALRVAAAGAANEGVSQTLVGLKANTRYVIGCRAKVNAGGDIFSLTTTGATGATFGNLALTTSSTTYTTVAGVILTDGTPTNIVVSLLAVADGDSIDVTHVWVRECGTDRLPMASSSWAYGEIATATANHYAAGTLTDSGITGVAVTPPGPGYVIEVLGEVVISAGTGDDLVAQIRENGASVRVSYGNIATGNDVTSIPVHFIQRSPTPGTTYTYTLFAASRNSAVGRNLGESSAIAGETPTTWLMARAVLESGGH
jgi:hypothetical protein